MSDRRGQQPVDDKPNVLNYATPEKRMPAFYISEVVLLSALHFGAFISLFIAEMALFGAGGPPSWLRVFNIALTFPFCVLFRDLHVDNVLLIGMNSLFCGSLLAYAVQDFRRSRDRRKRRHGDTTP